jgi:hypothetical protein
MSSIFCVFPDAQALLSLPPDDLAFRFLPYFRSLPWQIRSGVLSCVSLSVQRYPREVRAPLLHALMSAWEYLNREGLLNAKQRAPQLLIPGCCLSHAASWVAPPAPATTQAIGPR